MPRSKMYFKYDIPKTVVELVKAFCADYHRRERAIKFSNVTGEVLERYVELNAVIDRALEEVEVGIREDILRDIRKRKGYDFSAAASCLSKNTYYRRKRKLIYDIAKGLSLLP